MFFKKIGLLLVGLLVLCLIAAVLSSTFLFWKSGLFSPVAGSQEVAMTSPNGHWQISLKNEGDGMEPDRWIYTLTKLPHGPRIPLPICEGGGRAVYKLLRWASNERFQVQAQQQPNRPPRLFLIDIRAPRIPCEFPGMDHKTLAQPAVQTHYVIVPTDRPHHEGLGPD